MRANLWALTVVCKYCILFGNCVRGMSKAKLGPSCLLQHFFSCSGFGGWPTWQHFTNRTRIQGTDPACFFSQILHLHSNLLFGAAHIDFYPDLIVKATICAGACVIQVWLSAILLCSCIKLQDDVTAPLHLKRNTGGAQ